MDHPKCFEIERKKEREKTSHFYVFFSFKFRILISAGTLCIMSFTRHKQPIFNCVSGWLKYTKICWVSGEFCILSIEPFIYREKERESISELRR